ncbi:hypothetical protein HOP50_09g54290 [Chloropicon primus]|uniref:Uncharacterized protein n=1 Tax=Chloropicon primus TaxID=1764295 RepID=A0A5B8MR75_9CHLO|nr:hypothetical protein A3770_09p53990 [Chloropicon primus]UPR02105.1 hypothetical protein HOP50_09g54290 [Chloropicon primus]|eukprot:QDZ22881.1 hypothetical protein A3770_09p53990 [Chloropicon primus]
MPVDQDENEGLGVETVPVEVVVARDDCNDCGSKESGAGSDDLEDGGSAPAGAKVWKRRDSEGLKSDMEKYAPAPKTLGGRLFCLAGEENSFRAKLVRCDREYYPGEDWTRADTQYTAVAVFVFVVWACINVWQDRNSFMYNTSINYPFWLKMFFTVFFNIIISGFVGYFVVTREWRIGYGRKILHFCLFASPVLVNSIFGEIDTKVMGLSWLALVCQAYFFILLKPIRRRLPIPFLLAFRAMDRPKDRPYTVPWLWVQSFFGFLAMLLLQIYLSSKNLSDAFFLIPLVVNGLGDGLAEPVGIRFGKHKYQTRALFYKGKFCSGEFIRSLEGSACVFFSAVMAVFMMYNEWQNTTRFVIALAIVPITMTAAEAFSPHTCDTPFIFLVATALICFLFEAVDDNFDPFSPDYSH